MEKKKVYQTLTDIVLFVPAIIAWLVMLLISIVHGVLDGLK